MAGSLLILVFALSCDASANINDDLIQAVWHGREQTVRALLATGLDLNVTDVYGSPILMIAVARGNKNIVEQLLSKGALVNVASTITGETPLITAAATGRAELAKLLLSRGAEVNAVSANGITALIAAATVEQDQTEIVNELLNRGSRVNVATREEGLTALMAASGNGYTKMVQALLAKGADVNARDRSGQTALHHAIMANKPEILELLLSKSADVNAKETKGRTPLMYSAILGSKLEVMNLLLSRGADVRAKTPDGRTVLTIARKKNRAEIVQWLLKAGATE